MSRYARDIGSPFLGSEAHLDTVSAAPGIVSEQLSGGGLHVSRHLTPAAARQRALDLLAAAMEAERGAVAVGLAPDEQLDPDEIPF